MGREHQRSKTVAIQLNNRGPIIPPGSYLQAPDPGRFRIRLAVFVVAGLLCFGAVAAVLQGCNSSSKGQTASTQSVATNPLPAFEAPPGVPVSGDNTSPAPATTLPASTPQPVRRSPRLPGKEYTVEKGDSFAAIAHRFHIPLRALEDSNPGLNPTRLQIGQVIVIPAPAVPATNAPARTPANS